MRHKRISGFDMKIYLIFLVIVALALAVCGQEVSKKIKTYSIFSKPKIIQATITKTT